MPSQVSKATGPALLLFKDPSCTVLNTTIADPFNAFRSCAQNALLIYPYPLVMTCDGGSNSTIMVTDCPSVKDLTAYAPASTGGCRSVTVGSQVVYFNQDCTENGLTSSPSNDATAPVNSNSSAHGVPLAIILTVVIISAVLLALILWFARFCYVKMNKKRLQRRWIKKNSPFR